VVRGSAPGVVLEHVLALSAALPGATKTSGASFTTPVSIGQMAR
jgi:hypothetical protein